MSNMCPCVPLAKLHIQVLGQRLLSLHVARTGTCSCPLHAHDAPPTPATF